MFNYYPYPVTIVSGQSQATLQAWLVAAQNALNQLMIGGRPVSVSYGEKSVSYTQANMSTLVQWIYLLQLQLGLVRPRRALVPIFR